MATRNIQNGDASPQHQPSVEASDWLPDSGDNTPPFNGIAHHTLKVELLAPSHSLLQAPAARVANPFRLALEEFQRDALLREARFEAMVDELNGEAQECQAQLQLAEATADELRERVAELEEELSREQRFSERLQGRVAAYQEAAEKEEQRFRQQLACSDALVAAREATISTLEAELRQLRATSRGATTQAAELRIHEEAQRLARSMVASAPLTAAVDTAAVQERLDRTCRKAGEVLIDVRQRFNDFVADFFATWLAEAAGLSQRATTMSPPRASRPVLDPLSFSGVMNSSDASGRPLPSLTSVRTAAGHDDAPPTRDDSFFGPFHQTSGDAYDDASCDSDDDDQNVSGSMQVTHVAPIRLTALDEGNSLTISDTTVSASVERSPNHRPHATDPNGNGRAVTPEGTNTSLSSTMVGLHAASPKRAPSCVRIRLPDTGTYVHTHNDGD
jgi:hypothetical protein